MAKNKNPEHIKQAVDKAKQHFQKGEIEQALAVLEPYENNKKVQSIIAGIKRRTQEVQQVKTKRQPIKSLVYAVWTFVILACVVILFVPSSPPPKSPQSETDNESVPEASNLVATYYAKHDNARLRTCEKFDCPVMEILEFGQAIKVITSVSGDAMGAITTWYEVDGGGYIHALDILESPPPTPRPNAPYVPPPGQSGSGSSSGGSSGGSSSGGGSSVPQNCSEAVAMGLSAQQAAQYSHLDRDNDGVACYGD